MTLKPYDPEMLDQFALRMLDLAALFRNMANRSREFDINKFTLHDKKAMEWHSNIERWARKAESDLEMRIIDARATQRTKSAYGE